METATPEAFIAALEEPRRADIQRLHDLIRAALPELEPGVASGMLGYGPFHYRYASGREGDAFRIAVASRKGGISVYVLAMADGQYVAERHAARLGKVSVGKSCVRFKRTDHVDLEAFEALLADAGRHPPEGSVEG